MDCETWNNKLQEFASVNTNALYHRLWLTRGFYGIKNINE